MRRRYHTGPELSITYATVNMMILDPPTSEDRPLRERFDFSLVLGGPLFQLLRRTHLSDDALTLVSKRILAFFLLTWLPLLGLSALGWSVP
jgi:hypothetical protein